MNLWILRYAQYDKEFVIVLGVGKLCAESILLGLIKLRASKWLLARFVKRLSFQVFVSKICTRHQRLLKKAKIQQNAFCPKNLQIKDKFKI